MVLFWKWKLGVAGASFQFLRGELLIGREGGDFQLAKQLEASM